MSEGSGMAAVPVKLLFADGAVHTLQAREGQRLVDAASEAGLGLLTDCGNGQCGTCAAQCVSGGMELGDYDSAILPDDEREDGAILCCVAQVTGPAVIELPYDACDANAAEPPAQKGRVVSVAPIAREIVRLEVETGEPVHFLPGQYVRLRPAGLDGWRSYSMANPSGEKRLVFYIRTVETGVFSRWLASAPAPGTPIEVGAPRGSFFLRDEARPRLFVAGGSGLAPFLAMLEALRGQGAGSRAPTRLLVGARTGDHLFAREELARLQNEIPGLEVTYACESQPPAGAHAGYATDLIQPGCLAPSTRVYLCGPPPMVDAARAASLKAGARKGDVLCERFA